jgi:glycopeptide antibiotics resistance protein
MILRILLYIAIPVALELVQYAYGVGVGVIDDVCTFLGGEILGIIIYHLLDAVYMYNHKRHFMESKDSIKGYFIK